MIFITGASSGIGEACAEIFAQNNHNLFLVARNFQKLEELKKSLCGKYKIQVEIASLDLKSENEIIKFFHDNQSKLTDVDTLINNAGLAIGLGPTHELDFSAISAMIDTNLKALIYMSKLMTPIFIKKNHGHIINIGSVAGHHVYPNGNVYCATKSAVHAMSEALRYDLLGKGIRVSEISPGMVNTNFSTVRLGDSKKAEKVYEGMNPLTARDIAEAVLWSFERPKHVNISEIVIYPTDQVSPFQVHRKKDL
jgi:3-hydroxy acid dehydrogenase/malonic semialdehyde reductase